MTLLPILAMPALLGVIAFHMVKPNSRHLRVSMSALMPEPPKSDAPKTRFSLTQLLASLRFWIRFLAMLLLGAALYPFLIERPVPAAAPDGVRIVFDLSPSMALGPASGPSRLKDAVSAFDAALAAIRAMGPKTEAPCVDVAFVDGSLTARISLADVAEIRAQRPGRDGMPAAALTAALGLNAPAGCRGQASHAIIITDQPPRAVSDDEFTGHVIWYQVGEGLSNVSLTDLSVRGGGIGDAAAELEIRAKSHGARPSAVSVSVSHAGAVQEVVLRPEESGGDGWIATLPYGGSGEYVVELGDGGAYPGDDRITARLPAVTDVSVDWRMASTAKPKRLRQSSAETGGILVSEYSPGMHLPKGPFVLVHRGWSGGAPDHIGAFMDDHVLLDHVNFDVVERSAPSGLELSTAAAETMLSIMRLGRRDWIAMRETPPGAIIPFDPLAGSDVAQISWLLLANALRFASGDAGRQPQAISYVASDGTVLQSALLESDTARKLAERPDFSVLKAPSRTGKKGDIVPDPVLESVAIAQWLLVAALLVLLGERIVGPVWTRRTTP